MMSAPSWASRIAWLRPCPRAAPVMKATLPSSFPVTPLAPFTSVTISGALSAVLVATTTKTANKEGWPGLAAGAEAGQGALVAGRVRRTPADRHGYRLGPVRVVPDGRGAAML